jgi:hypothetical protein
VIRTARNWASGWLGFARKRIFDPFFAHFLSLSIQFLSCKSRVVSAIPDFFGQLMRARIFAMQLHGSIAV